MIFIGDTIKLFRGAKTVGYRFLPSGEEREGLMLRSDTGDGKQFLMLPTVVMSPPPKAPESGAPPGHPPRYSREQEQEFASQVSGVALTKGVIDQIEIDTGDMKPVIAALQACTDDLLKYWKIDVDKQRSQTRAVLPDGDTSDWLPRGMIGFQDFGKLGGGANMVRLLVDETGKPTDCAIHFPSLQKLKNDGICKNLLEKAHFMPALDANGQPFASYYMTSPLFLLGPPPGRGGR